MSNSKELDYERGRALIGAAVRVKPEGGKNHWTRGKLVGASRTYAEVQPDYHGRPVRVSWSRVRLWQSILAIEGKEILMQQKLEEPATRTKAKAAAHSMHNMGGDVLARQEPSQPDPEPAQRQPDPQSWVLYDVSQNLFWSGCNLTGDPCNAKLWGPGDHSGATGCLTDLRCRRQSNCQHLRAMRLIDAEEMATAPPPQPLVEPRPEPEPAKPQPAPAPVLKLSEARATLECLLAELADRERALAAAKAGIIETASQIDQAQKSLLAALGAELATIREIGR